METTTFTQSNYITHYNAIQVSLPMNIGTIIDPNDEVVSFLKVMEGVNCSKYIKNVSHRGRKGYDKGMLLRIILFAYMINVRDYRSIEDRCKHDIRFMLLADHQQPSHMAFQRFENEYLKGTIDEVFFDISKNIGTMMNIDESIQYIDGTKIEANANKYTFVYKARILNARMKMFKNITEDTVKMNMDTGFNFEYKYMYCAQEIGYTVQYLMDVMVNENIKIVYGKGKRKSHIQRWYDRFLSYYTKLEEYEYWLYIIGEERNSCSKTDHDATMCATKMDYYCNTGLSRPCYNAQTAVSDGIIVNADLFQRPGDTKTFIPFMERFKEYRGFYPEFPVADAAYGSYDNYMYCLTHGIDPVMKYSMYAKKNEAKFKKNIYNPLNWKTDDKGSKICPMEHVFDEYTGERYDESGEYLKIIQRYKSKNTCAGCPHREECCKGKGENKTVSRNAVLDEFYAVVDENLSSEFGKELKKQRSIQAEGAFGVIKEDMKFTRFTRRGIEKVKMEYLLVCTGYNLKKYHKYRLRETKKQQIN